MRLYKIYRNQKVVYHVNQPCSGLKRTLTNEEYGCAKYTQENYTLWNRMYKIHIFELDSITMKTIAVKFTTLVFQSIDRYMNQNKLYRWQRKSFALSSKSVVHVAHRHETKISKNSVYETIFLLYKNIKTTTKRSWTTFKIGPKFTYGTTIYISHVQRQKCTNYERLIKHLHQW